MQDQNNPNLADDGIPPITTPDLPDPDAPTCPCANCTLPVRTRELVRDTLTLAARKEIGDRVRLTALEGSPAALAYLARVIELGMRRKRGYVAPALRAAESMLRYGLGPAGEQRDSRDDAGLEVLREIRKTAEAMREVMGARLAGASAVAAIEAEPAEPRIAAALAEPGPALPRPEGRPAK